MPDDGIMLTLSADEWRSIMAALRLAYSVYSMLTWAYGRNERDVLDPLIDKLADRLNFDLEKMDGTRTGD